MDIKSTSHMTFSGGNLTSYSYMSNNIFVGSGHNIRGIGRGNVMIYHLTLFLVRVFAVRFGSVLKVKVSRTAR